MLRRTTTEPPTSDILGVRGLATAVIKQAYSDLSSPCLHTRRDGARFFTQKSVWFSIAGVDRLAVQERHRKKMDRAFRAVGRCRKLTTTGRCPHCGTIY